MMQKNGPLPFKFLGVKAVSVQAPYIQRSPHKTKTKETFFESQKTQYLGHQLLSCWYWSTTLPKTLKSVSLCNFMS